MGQNKKDNKMVRNSLILILQLSLYMLVPIFVCIAVTYYIGEKIGNKNVIIIGIIVGIVAGFNGVYRQVKVYLKDEESPGQKARRLENESKNDNKMDETPK